MKHDTLSAAWLLSASSALLLGASVACKNETGAGSAPGATDSARAGLARDPAAAGSAAQAGSDKTKDCCMGLNDCKGKGGCAVPESHACRGQNACKGQGGCNAHCPQ